MYCSFLVQKCYLTKRYQVVKLNDLLEYLVSSYFYLSVWYLICNAGIVLQSKCLYIKSFKVFSSFFSCSSYPDLLPSHPLTKGFMDNSGIWAPDLLWDTFPQGFEHSHGRLVPLPVCSAVVSLPLWHALHRVLYCCCLHRNRKQQWVWLHVDNKLYIKEREPPWPQLMFMDSTFWSVNI